MTSIKKSDRDKVIGAIIVVLVVVVLGFALRARAQPVTGQVTGKAEIIYTDGTKTVVSGTNKLKMILDNLIPQTITEKTSGKEVAKVNLFVYSYANWEGPMTDWDVSGDVKIYLTDPDGNTETKYDEPVKKPDSLKKGEWQIYHSIPLSASDLESWCGQYTSDSGQYTLTLWIGLKLDIWFEDGTHDSRQASGRSLSWLFYYDAGASVPYQITNWDPQPKMNAYY